MIFTVFQFSALFLVTLVGAMLLLSLDLRGVFLFDRNSPEKNAKAFWIAWPFAYLFVFLFCLATTHNYFHPAQKIYSNASHNVFQEIGYSFDNTIYLSNQGNTKSIDDSLTGLFAVKAFNNDSGFNIQIEDINYPVFCRSAKVAKMYAPYIPAKEIDTTDYFLIPTINFSLFKDSIQITDNELNLSLIVLNDDDIKLRLNNSEYKLNKRVTEGITIGALLKDADNATRERLNQYWLIRPCYSSGNTQGFFRPIVNKIISLFSNKRKPLFALWIKDKMHAAVVKSDIQQFNSKHNNTIVDNGSTFFYGFPPNLRSTRYQLLHQDHPVKQNYLKYSLPEMHNLYQDDGHINTPYDVNLFMVCSVDQINRHYVNGSEDSLLQGGYILSGSKNEFNDYQCNAQFSYNVNHTDRPINSRIIDLLNDSIYNPKADEYISLTCSGDRHVKRMVKISDFKAKSYLNEKKIYEFISIYSILVFSILFIQLSNGPIGRNEKLPFPWYSLGLEAIIYFIFLPLFTLKLFLFWRVTVFPPIYNITPGEYFGKFQNVLYLDGLLFEILGLLFLRLVFVIISKLKNRSSVINSVSLETGSLLSLLRSVGKPFRIVYSSILWTVIASVVLFTFTVIFGKIIIIPQITVFAVIIIPVILWIISESISTKVTTEVGLPDYIKKSKLSKFIPYPITNGHIIRLICIVTLLVVFLVSDKGYFILFVNFLLIRWIIKSVYGINDIKITSKFYKAINLLASLLAPLLFYLLLVHISETSLSNYFPATRYRSLIKTKSVNDIISSLHFNSDESQSLMNVVQNQWFIDQYQEDQDSLRDHSLFFQLRPHFKEGSDYITQTRDLLTVRYLIAEHNKSLVLFIALCLAVPLVFMIARQHSLFQGNAEYFVTYYPSWNPFLLIFVSAIMVWLTSTNHYVFFGQDFPFLCIFTHSNSIYFFLLIVTGFCVFITEEHNS